MNNASNVKKYTLCGVMLALIAIFSYLTFYYSLKGVAENKIYILYGLGFISFVGAALFVSFLIFREWQWIAAFSVAAAVPIVFFIELNGIVFLWLVVVCAGFFFTGRKIQGAAENQLTILVTHTFHISEMLLITTLSFLAALLVYAGIPYRSLNIGQAIYDSSVTFVDKIITFQFPYYRQDMSIEQIALYEMAKEQPVSILPRELQRELQTRYGWSGESIGDLLENPEARKNIFDSIASQIPQGAFEEQTNKISDIAAGMNIPLEVKPEDTPHEIMENFLTKTAEQFKAFIPPAFAISVFLIFRFVGIFIGIVAVLIASLAFYALRATGAVKIVKEPKEKEVISF